MEFNYTQTMPTAFLEAGHRIPWSVAAQPLVEAMAHVANDAVANTPWDVEADAYKVQEEPGSEHVFSVAIETDWPGFWPKETGAAEHFPPYGEDSRFAEWAAQAGVDPFLAALAYSKSPHEGEHMFERAWVANLPRIKEAMRLSVANYLRGAL